MTDKIKLGYICDATDNDGNCEFYRKIVEKTQRMVMMYDNLDQSSRNNVRRCKAESDIVENAFKKALEKLGFEVRKTTVKQDLKHKDFWITDNSCHICSKPKLFSVDVKNQRKNWEGKPCHSLEFKKFGYDGWSLVTDGPDMFAFETTDSYLLIWSYVARNETLRIMRELKTAGARMIQDAKYARDCCEYRQYLVQENNRGNNYYCLISRQDAKKMSFMEVPKC